MVWCLCFTDQNLARKFLSQIKWDNLKLCVKWFLDHAFKRIVANRKMVLETRGFMVYCGCTYDFIPPYLKGIHLSLEVWRPNKFVYGWQCEDDPYPMFAAAIEEKDFIP
jgi:hypothetical protein